MHTNCNTSRAKTSQDNTVKIQTAPSVTVAITASVCWGIAIGLLLLLGLDVAGYVVGGIAGLLILAGIFWRPLRSGLSPEIVHLAPIWGIVARLDRISTCYRLRTAGIYTSDDATATIPATTSSRRDRQAVRTYTVIFNGAGQAGMSPDRIRRQLELNCRVWGCRSFAFQEDDKRPGRYVIQLSTSAHVRTTLDSPVVGVLDPLGAYQLPDDGWEGWEGWDDLDDADR